MVPSDSSVGGSPGPGRPTFELYDELERAGLGAGMTAQGGCFTCSARMGRPSGVSGLPILDRVHPLENLYLATGHSMLGITLAPASGRALTDYVMSGKRSAPLEPFRLDRFGNHH